MRFAQSAPNTASTRMTTDSRPPIPTPLSQRMDTLRIRILPVALLATALVAGGFLWRNQMIGPAIVGQAEPIVAQASSYRSGIVSELRVDRFQTVKAGDPVAKVTVIDPQILVCTLDVIRAEIERLRAELKPIVLQQQTAMKYDQLQLNWMRQRTDLATARVNLQLAETECQRMDELFKDKIISERVHDQAKATRDRLSREVQELEELVAAVDKNLKALQSTNLVSLSEVSPNPLQAAIAVQESKLKLTEAESTPVIVRAPIDGVVTGILRRSGEDVKAGEAIVSISTLNAVRIVGYLRPPLHGDLKPGMRVQVSTRRLPRGVGSAQVLQVGRQFENVPPPLLGPVKFANTDLGLPIDVSVPANLDIHPGELVDLSLVSPSS